MSLQSKIKRESLNLWHYARYKVVRTDVAVFYFPASGLPPLLAQLIDSLLPTRKMFELHFLAMTLRDLGNHNHTDIKNFPDFSDEAGKMSLDYLIAWLSDDAIEAVRLFNFFATQHVKASGSVQFRRFLERAYVARREHYYRKVLKALEFQCTPRNLKKRGPKPLRTDS